MPDIPLNNDFKVMARIGNAVLVVAALIFIWGFFELFEGKTDKLFQGAALFVLSSLLQGLAQVLRILTPHALNIRQWQLVEGKSQE